MASPWFDTHVHLDMYPEAERPGLLKRAGDADVGALLAIGGGTPGSSVDLPAVYGAAGVHPKRAATFAGLRGEVVAALDGPGMVAVGEIGFDRDGPALDVQYAAFREQVALARERDLAVVLHIDDDWERLLEPLKVLHGVRTVRHYFTGTAEQAAWHAERGHYLSFGRPLLRLPHLPPIAAAYPAGLLVIETDSYPLAGRTTAPCDIGSVGGVLAEIRGWSLEECRRRLWGNSLRAFRL